MISAPLYPRYLQYKDLATAGGSSLISGLVASYNFEGNSNDLAGARNGTDTSISYGPSYGKITDGAAFNGSTSKIVIPSLTTGSSFTIGFWLYPQASANAYETIFTNGLGGTGVYFNPSAQLINFYELADHQNSSAISLYNWHCIVITCNAGSLKIYVDGILDSPTFTGITGAALTTFGWDSFSEEFTGYLDIFNVWSRELTLTEIAAFYNGGAGLQYPF